MLKILRARPSRISFLRHLSSRDAVAHSVAAAATSAPSHLCAQLATTPGATLRISGSCAAVRVNTNMETGIAGVQAHIEGAACDPSTVVSMEVNVDGNICLVTAQHDVTIMVDVPAAFNVRVDMCASSAPTSATVTPRPHPTCEVLASLPCYCGLAVSFRESSQAVCTT